MANSRGRLNSRSNFLLHSGKVTIELFDASMIVKELIFRSQIRNAFFPGAVLDVEEIKAMLLGTGNHSDEQLSKLADEISTPKDVGSRIGDRPHPRCVSNWELKRGRPAP